MQPAMLLCYKACLHMLCIPERSKFPYFESFVPRYGYQYCTRPRSLIHYYWILICKYIGISALTWQISISFHSLKGNDESAIYFIERRLLLSNPNPRLSLPHLHELEHRFTVSWYEIKGMVVFFKMNKALMILAQMYFDR